MGFVVCITAYYDWEITYFVQTWNEDIAKEKAYSFFKNTVSCYLPNTVQEAENTDGICIEVKAKIEQIIL